MTANQPHRPGKILIMDDDPLLLRTAGLMLNRLGYDMVLARDGAEAVALYRENLATDYPVDAAILDIRVPGGMGAQEAAKAILALDAGARLVVSSGSTGHPAMVDWETYGFRAVLDKPFDLGEMGMVLGELLE